MKEHFVMIHCIFIFMIKSIYDVYIIHEYIVILIKINNDGMIKYEKNVVFYEYMDVFEGLLSCL